MHHEADKNSVILGSAYYPSFGYFEILEQINQLADELVKDKHQLLNNRCHKSDYNSKLTCSKSIMAKVKLVTELTILGPLE